MIIHDYLNAEYHSCPEVSKSMLDLIHIAPALLSWVLQAPIIEVRQKSLDLGTAIHAALLEADRFGKEYVCVPKIDKRTTKGKETLAAFELEHEDKIIMSPEDFFLVTSARDSALAHPIFKMLYQKDHNTESSIFWDSPIGVRCKCRPDFLLSERASCVDVKTTKNFRKFSDSILGYRYHVQQSHYEEGIEMEYREKCDFYFLVIQTEISCGRLPVHFGKLDQETVRVGKKERNQDLEAYKYCNENNTWPGVETFSIPGWAK